MPSALVETNDRYQKIVAGQVVEFSHRLPDGVASVEVARSSLLITGYYERYGTLLLSRR